MIPMKKIQRLSIFFSIFQISLSVHAITITQAQANACALEASGATIVAGVGVVNNTNQFVVAQYLANGSLDDSFNGTGVATTAIGTSATALAIVNKSNGQSIAVGYAMIGGATQIALACYESNGSLNNSFGTNGIVTTPLGSGASGNAAALDSSGNILVAGVANFSYVPQLFVARYTSAGSLDASFNASGSTPGVATLQIGYSTVGNAIAIQSDGKILVAGVASFSSGNQFAIARFNTNGTLDTSFNSGGSQPGVVTTQIGVMSKAMGIAVTSSGAIIVAGSSDSSLCMAAYTSSGVLNTSFGTNGIVLNTLGTSSQATDVAIDSSGNIVMTGISDDSLLVIRYTSAGVLDTTFNTTGYVIFSYQGDSAGNALQILSTGDILSVGSIVNTGVSDYLVVAYKSTGVLDSLWQINGVVNVASSSVMITETEASGTNGGTFTAGSWQIRTLNTLSNTGIATLANNQFTLQPGLYTINANAPAYLVNGHQARLQNITSGTTQLLGTSAFSPSSGGSMTTSFIRGQFSISQASVFEIQHICATTEANNGFGIASGFGNEVYTMVAVTADALY